MKFMKLRERIGRWFLGEWMNRVEAILLDIDSRVDKMSVAFAQSMDDVYKSDINLKSARLQLEEAKQEVLDAKRIVNEIVDVGTDIEYHANSGSWAVVCIGGRAEYVKFVRLDARNARNVLDFLKTFQYSNHVVDAPFGFDHDHWLR